MLKQRAVFQLSQASLLSRSDPALNNRSNIPVRESTIKYDGYMQRGRQIREPGTSCEKEELITTVLMETIY